MPPKPFINPHEMLEVLKSFNIFDDKNDLKPRSDEVWEEAATSLLPKKISSNTLNFYVRNNRWNLLNHLKEHFEISIHEVSVNESTLINDSSLDYVPYNYTENKDLKCPLLLFNLDLTENEWKCIYPESKLYKDKVRHAKPYKVLKSGWTDVIASKCFDKTKIPCAFIFNFGKVSESPEAAVYIHIRGVCKECGALFDAHCLNEPAPGDGIVFSVRTFDTRQIPHSAKRPVKGILRAEIGKELLYKKPRMWRNKATDNMSFGDCEPPTLPRDATLRKLKEQATNSEVGIDSRLNVVDSLCELKYKGKYAGYIKDVGKDRFYCFYWSPMQISLYNSLIKKFKKVEVDATGSLVKSISTNNGERRPIFLYQMIVRGENGIQPVFQMLSEKHDANFISYWMREILRDGASTPPEVNCDYSMALLNATSLAYNEMSLKKYILNCFKYLTSESIYSNLKCLIRVDIAHLIKIMCKKEVFKGAHPKVKDFFVRCVGIMSTCDNIEDLSELLKSLLIVAGSQYSGKNDTGKDVVCAKKHTFLINRIKTFTFCDEDDDDNEDEREYDYLDNECDDNPDIIIFLEKILEDSQREIDLAEETDTLNAFYCPEIINHIIKLARHFPIWTNLMLSYFTSASDVASSARGESYFRILKKSDLGPDYRPVRADKFVIKHIKSVESISKLEKALSIKNRVKIALSNKEIKLQNLKETKISINKKKKTNKRIKKSDLKGEPEKKKLKDENENEHLKFQENWLGKNWEAKHESQSFDLSNDSQIDELPSLEHPIKKVPFVSSTPDADFNNNNLEKKNNNSAYDETSTFTNDEVKSQNDTKSPINDIKINRVRGKYLRACPNVELIYDKPLRKRQGKIIQNGGKCNPVFINGTKIYVTNTCGFDAPVEIFTCCYSNYSKFKNEIERRKDNIFFSLIHKYAHEGISPSLNLNRAEILCMLFKTENNYLDCYGSSNLIVEKLITDTPSIVIHKRCSTCTIMNRSVQIVSMADSHANSDSNFETHLKNFVTDLVEKKDGICRKCKSAITITTTVGPYLIIDPEIFFQCNRTQNPQGITINEIPQELNVKNDIYILGGLVKHTPGHFTALCRNPNNRWYEFNDMCKKAVIIQNANNFAFNCSTIFYVKL